MIIVAAMLAATAAPDSWYTQGNFSPVERVAIHIRNPLREARTNSPVVIRSADLPMLRDVHELSITLVDPTLPSAVAPSAQQQALGGAHGRLAETHGHAIDYQLDDLDQDGMWDEMFFMADFAAGEDKTIYVYVGRQFRGWNPHRTHAGIGSYMRHSVPFWESANVGWKLWYPTDVDVYAKRKPQLMSNRLYMDNLDGYAVSLIDPGLGSDIMDVADSFGGGGIGIFDDPAHPDVVSRPRFTPRAPQSGNFNAGPQSDTRYAFSLIANGPLRSMVRVRTMNWDSGKGHYALEQTYTAYAGQDYSTAKVRYTEFQPVARAGVKFGVGIRKHAGKNAEVQTGGLVISAGPATIRNPDDLEAVQPNMQVTYAGTALVVADKYKPRYLYSAEHGGNHVMRIDITPDHSYEYLLAAGWSEGEGPSTEQAFVEYVGKVAREYNAPIEFLSAAAQHR